MTVVELGANRFIECRSLIGYRGASVLAVDEQPLRVSLRVPDAGAPNSLLVEVEAGRVVRGEGITVDAEERSFAIYSHDVLVAVALRRSNDIVHLKLDLRPLGLELYDDGEGLHIGTNTFARNEFRNAAVAIALG